MGDVVHLDLDADPAAVAEASRFDLFHEPPFVHDANAVCKVLHLVQEVAPHEDRHVALLRKPAEQVPYLDGARRVQAVRRLIQDEEPRRMHQGPGER